MSMLAVCPPRTVTDAGLRGQPGAEILALDEGRGSAYPHTSGGDLFRLVWLKIELFFQKDMPRPHW